MSTSIIAQERTELEQTQQRNHSPPNDQQIAQHQGAWLFTRRQRRCYKPLILKNLVCRLLPSIVLPPPPPPAAPPSAPIPRSAPEPAPVQPRTRSYKSGMLNPTPTRSHTSRIALNSFRGASGNAMRGANSRLMDQSRRRLGAYVSRWVRSAISRAEGERPGGAVPWEED